MGSPILPIGESPVPHSMFLAASKEVSASFRALLCLEVPYAAIGRPIRPLRRPIAALLSGRDPKLRVCAEKPQTLTP
jgi:hypothetical protein